MRLVGEVGVGRDLFGFHERKCPAPLVSTRPTPMASLNQFIQGLRGQHFQVRLIIAGSNLLSSSDYETVDYAVYRLRDICSGANIGVGRVTWQLLTEANSQGHATITTSAEVRQAGVDITADGDFIPVVIPAIMDVTRTVNGVRVQLNGLSPIAGPCEPRTGPGMRSIVIDIVGEETGRTLAHEVGHYLGAGERTPADNSLMTQTHQVTSGDPFNAVAIHAADRATMLAHCTINPGLTGF
ncbi:hypothetical protein ACW9HR_35855 [Nocardia gipuzkoensis]